MWKKPLLCLFFIPLLIALVAVQAPAQKAPEPNPAKAKLKEASSLRRTSFKKPKVEKNRILLETAAVYESLIARCAEFKPECAQASFRAGEIYRTLGMVEKAESSFLRTLEFEQKGEFAARSLVEVGHIARRAKDYPAAIIGYERVLTQCPDVRDECADAVTWIGKVLLKMKDYEKGRQKLLAFERQFPEFPVAAIRNIDVAAQSLINEERYDEAAAMIEDCVNRFEAKMGDDPKADKKVEKALSKMKSAERLAARSRSASTVEPADN